MKPKKCPMCEGEHFYRAALTSYGPVWVRLGFFNQIPVLGSICLSCGFVAPSVDHGGLIAIREKARSEGMAIDGKPSKEDLREL